MRKFTGLMIMLMVAGCATTGPDALQQTLARSDRSAADVERDVRSRPDVVLRLLRLEAGDRVADIFAGGGYYSDILSGVVGSEGRVLLHNNAAYRQFARVALASRFDGRDPGNIIMHNAEVDDLMLGSNDPDAAIMIMSYHDLYFADPENGWPAIDADQFLDQIYRALVPGGRFLVVDHAAPPGSGNRSARTVHRIDPEFAREDIERHGFKLIRKSEVLRNPDDDYSLNVFDPAVRGKTDRFVYVFRKPG
ncbi:MAG: hypothetical protein O2780_14305 [Proteobacteria bacterium]|nr:hypothetical protein [Pseudomonadota bacterium]